MLSKENKSEQINLTDHMIGWLSAFIILALTWLIISISYIPKKESSNNSILSGVFWTWKNTNNSWIVLSPIFPNINNLIFDRKNDSISFYTNSGSAVVQFPSQKKYNKIPYSKINIQNIEYTINADGWVLDNNWLYIGKAILPQQIVNWILMESWSRIVSLTNNWIYTYTWSYTEISDIVISKEWNTIVWKSKSLNGWYNIYKNGEILWNEEIEISNISISNNWKIVMYKTRGQDSWYYINKNWEKIEKILKWYIEDSIKMNWIASIYTVENEGNIEIIHNWKILDRKFDEVREIFMEHNSDSFVYFGRPLWAKTYCLYTSYRGNLCWLSGYMNPKLSADGTSVIYAGLKDDVWWIYRNATPVIRNTGYSNREDISKDYAFFDITNPNYYLFIKHTDNGYKLYTKWTWISGKLKDIGLDVTFGYNNKIIMSVQDEKWWRILEF